MNRSVGMAMAIPFTLYVWACILADLLKYLRYRIVHKEEQDKSAVYYNEKPILVLEYNNTSQKVKRWICMIACIPLMLFGFFIADYAAQKDMHGLFFSLNQEQTYILYYWAWKFVSISILLYGGWLFINTILNKKVYFFDNVVFLENTLLGRRVLVLDNNIRFTKSIFGEILLYNELSMKHFCIFCKRLMRLDSQQEKLLDEILSKIPEKKKNFMF